MNVALVPSYNTGSVPQATAPAATAAPTPAQPQETFTPSSSGGADLKFWIRDVGLPVAVGAGIGVYAGAATGVLAAVAGTVTGFLGGAVVGLLTARALSSFAKDQGEAFTKMSFPAGIAGCIGGTVAGAVIGAAVSSPIAAVGLGAVGALGGALYAFARAWPKD